MQDLIDSHLVVEIGKGQSSGGRKPVMLLFNSQAGYAVGVDLGVNYIRGILTDLEGRGRAGDGNRDEASQRRGCASGTSSVSICN